MHAKPLPRAINKPASLQRTVPESCELGGVNVLVGGKTVGGAGRGAVVARAPGVIAAIIMSDHAHRGRDHPGNIGEVCGQDEGVSLLGEIAKLANIVRGDAILYRLVTSSRLVEMLSRLAISSSAPAQTDAGSQSM